MPHLCQAQCTRQPSLRNSRIVDPAQFEPYGITLYAINIPEGAQGIWNELSKFHGAVAFYSRKGKSLNYFPDQSAATNFHFEVQNTMRVPRIYDAIPGTRKEHDQLVKEIDELIDGGFPTADERQYPIENE